MDDCQPHSSMKPASPLTHNLHITSQTKPPTSLNWAQIKKGIGKEQRRYTFGFQRPSTLKEPENVKRPDSDWTIDNRPHPRNRQDCFFFHNVFVSSRIKNHFPNQKLWLPRIRKRGWKEHRRFSVGFKGLAEITRKRQPKIQSTQIYKSKDKKMSEAVTKIGRISTGLERHQTDWIAYCIRRWIKNNKTSFEVDYQKLKLWEIKSIMDVANDGGRSEEGVAGKARGLWNCLFLIVEDESMRAACRIRTFVLCVFFFFLFLKIFCWINILWHLK